ncbi:MAG TPA: FAD-dependent oxidoreductase [Propylenella sp.]|nr:FAD-dependent oxidoreductase [Propylenella sp.]
MNGLRILIVGAGIGGLTSAVALRQQGFEVELIEKDPEWKVYGVGIIQQANVVRAMAQLGLVEGYLHSGFGFNFIEVYAPSGQMLARVPVERLDERYPANVGVSRRTLHEFLGKSALDAGATIRLGVTAESIDDDGAGVTVTFSDQTQRRYDIVIGADGVYSATRNQLFPDAPELQFVGQSVWRYNFARPADLDCLRSYEGSVGTGLVPLSDSVMYMFVTTPEPGNPRYPREGLAAAMQAKLAGAPPGIRELVPQITDDAEVVYKPLERIFLEGPWHNGRVVLIGDAVHATTPHLGQGAGMAIEDSVVLAEELARAETPEEAFSAFRDRRFERCKYIVEQSVAICEGQLGIRPPVNQAEAMHGMFAVTAEPI